MDARRSLVMVFSLAAIVADVTPAGASTITYNLTGNPADLVNVPTGDSFIEKILFLTDADTGSSQIPGVAISPGDIINANISLSGPLNVPPGSSIILELQALPAGGSVGTAESVSYSNGGVTVAPPPGLGNISDSGGRLSLGQLTTQNTPSFLFDAVALSGTVTFITQSGQSVSSATLQASSPDLVLLHPAPIPVPAAMWLLLSGLGGLRFLVKRRP